MTLLLGCPDQRGSGQARGHMWTQKCTVGRLDYYCSMQHSMMWRVLAASFLDFLRN